MNDIFSKKSQISEHKNVLTNHSSLSFQVRTALSTLCCVDNFGTVPGGRDLHLSDEVVGELALADGASPADLQVTENARDVVAHLVKRPIMLRRQGAAW